ncbi:MAG: hypothetical protein IJ736_08615, partial [Firmicutes bacterium]|nr:hypothetical protein [Bacillota bacterium]
MKKFISVLVASCMLISSASTANAATGKIVDNRTLVPVRGVFEELGFVVIWNEKKSMATIKDKNYTIEIPKG